MYDFFSASEKSDVILVVEDKDFHVSRQVCGLNIYHMLELSQVVWVHKYHGMSLREKVLG